MTASFEITLINQLQYIYLSHDFSVEHVQKSITLALFSRN